VYIKKAVLHYFDPLSGFSLLIPIVSNNFAVDRAGSFSLSPTTAVITALGGMP
jgi:hypothetical protein